MRKLFLSVGLGLLIAMPALAKTEQVNVGGQQLMLQVQEQPGRKLYPLRAICNALDINIVRVDGNVIELQQGDNKVYYFIGEKLVANKTGYFTTDVAPISVNNTVYVPIKTLGYMFGYNIDHTNGMVISKKANFTPPKATYASYLLMQDLSIAEDIVQTIDPSYYLNALQGGITNYSWSHISDCKTYILSDRQTISASYADLKTQSGKAIYNASVGFLDAVYDTFCYMEMWDMNGVSASIDKVVVESQRLMDKR